MRTRWQETLTAAPLPLACRISHFTPRRHAEGAAGSTLGPPRQAPVDQLLHVYRLQQAYAAATVGDMGVRPRSAESWGPLSPVASHPSKVLGHYAPSTVLYTSKVSPTVKSIIFIKT